MSSDWQRRKYLRKIRREIVASVILILSSLIFIFPLYWMISTSLKPDSQILTFPPVWIPHPIVWSNYPRAISFIPFFTFLKNTLYVCILSVAGSVLSSSVVAYGFSRIHWPGRDILFIVVLATMMLPYQVVMVPLFILFAKIGWVGTFKPLWVPCFMGGAFYIFLLRQFFMTIPIELSDSAKIDGASHFTIFYRIILPLTKPALAVIALFQFLGSWSDFLGPLIYLTKEEKFTLAVGLQFFQGHFSTEWAMLMAASTLFTLPTIILFFFAQRTFIQGITLTGVKQ